MQLPADIPPEERAFLEELGYLDADRLQPGAEAPHFLLTPLNGGEPVAVPDPSRPTVLIFGSYT